MPDARFATGLVVGKFYPPHLGHSYLIDVARAQCAHLVVFVCDEAGQSIPGALRTAWLQELHPEVEVRCIDDHYPADDSQLWATLTREWLGYAPEAVFTSESYGVTYAAFLGSTHVSVDPQRLAVPVSATAVRADPLAMWPFIAAPVRQYYAARIVVVGAESTGTTTLTQALAQRYQSTWVPEYGRDYTLMKLSSGGEYRWETREFVHIAREQRRREDAAARAANRLLFCDTDALATALWHERYQGFWDTTVAAIGEVQHPTLTILTQDDIPFVQDGIRDGEKIRHWMSGRFKEVLTQAGRSFVVVSGTHEQRVEAAAAAIEQRVLAQTSWRPGQPDAVRALPVAPVA